MFVPFKEKNWMKTNFLHSYVYECGFEKQFIPFYVRAKVDSNIFRSKEQRKFHDGFFEFSSSKSKAGTPLVLWACQGNKYNPKWNH